MRYHTRYTREIDTLRGLNPTNETIITRFRLNKLCRSRKFNFLERYAPDRAMRIELDVGRYINFTIAREKQHPRGTWRMDLQETRPELSNIQFAQIL